MTFGNPAAIVVAHPGHEVRIHGFVERVRPRVFVLTDGSGRDGRSRIASTARYLEKFGASCGAIFGRFTDLEVYRLILARDFDAFTSLCDELAGAFIEEGIGACIGDASEGYNSTHDICRLITNAAVEIAERARGVSIDNYDFPIVNRPDHCRAALRERSVWLRLDDEAFARKMKAAFEFYPELAAETRDTLQGRGNDKVNEYFNLEDDEHAATDMSGLEMFRVECLRPVSHGDPSFESRAPFYELQGEMKVAAGVYEQVIRYRTHLRPLADALAERVERRC